MIDGGGGKRLEAAQVSHSAHLRLTGLVEVCDPPSEARAFDRSDILREMLVDTAWAHGFSGAVYMHLGHGFWGAPNPAVRIKPRGLVATGGFDEARYMRRNYLLYDPLARRALGSLSPFVWDLADFDQTQPGCRRMLGIMHAWGMHAGVVAPVQDYARGPAFLNLFAADDRADGPKADHGPIMLAAMGIHAAAGRLLPSASDVAQAARLSPREMEVLRLAAIGRTEQETGQTLALSRRGVQFHLARAMEKLCAPNKTAAVALAVNAGLIQI